MGTRILVVDDEETLRRVISEVLGDDGHDVVTAASGEEALERFRTEAFPLVITDVSMGRVSGLDLLREIKAQHDDTLVVVMTSHASLETATEALRAGAYDFLIKPFDDIEMISSVVHRATERIDLIRSNTELMNRLKAYAKELEELNGRLRAMVNLDGLTGLYNRRYFSEVLDVELNRCKRHGRKCSIVFMDLDHFKHYNDTHGHLAGDEALRTLAELLRERSRKTTVAARYGGEEFVLLLPETDKEGAEHLAGLIRGIVEEHPFTGEAAQPLGRITLSLGVATYPDDAEDGTKLIDHADQALYQAKAQGRNRVVVWSGSVPA